MDELTPRQEAIMSYILQEVEKKGYPPSVREIGEAVGLSSSSTVHAHLEKLEKLGYIRRDPTKPRAIEVISDNGDFAHKKRVYHIPILGKIAAGEPIFAEQNIEDYFPIPADMVPHEDVFVLKVKGESMIDAGILPDDFLIVAKQANADNGEIVVALINDEATVKRFYKENNRFKLQPENQNMNPIYTDKLDVLGKVVGLYRKI